MRYVAFVLSIALCGVASPFPSAAQTLRIAMTAADIPTPTGIPNNGSEGYRFLGFPAYDGLVDWDFTHPDKIAGITPAIFASWKIDDSDHKRWIFTLRQGVKFHDGTDVTLDAVIWNLQRIYDEKSPQFDPAGSAIIRSQVNMIDRWEKVDDKTIAILTKYPFSFLPYLIANILIASPTQWDKVGHSWTEFAKQPVGTGPFKITRVVQGQFVEMARNEAYWDKNRIPKVQKLVVIPMPEATTRLAALRSGEVDWIEVPPPDAIPSLKAAGFQVITWPYPHDWPYILNVTETSVFHDKRIRQALNYAIDRSALVESLNGTAQPATAFYPAGDPYFGTPTQHYGYDPDKAKALLKEAGYGPDHPVRAKIMISTAGSGQMLPIPMNELLQQQLKPLGFDLDFDVVEWGTMLVAKRSDPGSPASHHVDALNNSLPFPDPGAMFRYFGSPSFSPAGINWGHYGNPKVDDLLFRAQASFDPDEEAKLLGQAHAMIVDDAPWLFIVHDLNPRALSAKVKGFKPAQSWYQDFTQVTVE